MKKNLFFAAIAALSLAACSGHDELAETAKPVALQVNAEFEYNVTTRGVSGPLPEKWNSDAKIVVAAVEGTDGDKTTSNDATYTLSGTASENGKFTSDSPYFFTTNETSVTFNAFTFNSTTAPTINDGKITLSATDGSLDDLCTATNTGVSYSSPNVDFGFKHLLSKLTINVASGNGGTVSSAKVSGYASSATVDVKSFDVSKGDVSDTEVDFGTPSDGTCSIVLFLVPGEPNLTVTIENTAGRKYSVNVNFKIAKGTAYTCNIILSKIGLSSGSSTITSWFTQTAETINV
jgi:endonuclease G